MHQPENDSGKVSETDWSWILIAKTEYEKAKLKNGVDLSASNPTLNSSLTVYNMIGFYGSVSYSRMTGGESSPLYWSVDFGYDYSLTDWLDLSVSYSYNKYLTDSINTVFDLQNSLSFGCTADLEIVDFAVGYDFYFGSDPAHYLSADLSRSFELGNFGLDLSAGIVYMSQSIEASKLEALAIKLKKTQSSNSSANPKKKVNLSGISSYYFGLTLDYEAFEGFTISFSPSYIITPKGEISSKEKQLSWALGIKYLIKF